MNRSDVVNWVLGECTTVLDTSSVVSVANGSDHVDVASGGSPPRYPFVGVQQVGGTTQSTGIGNDTLIVDDLTYDSTGTLTQITFARYPEPRFEVIPVTDDDPKTRDGLLTELVDHFARYTEKSDTVPTWTTPTDMGTPSLDAPTLRNRTEDFVRASGIPITIPYAHYVVEDDPVAATTVNVDIDVGDTVHADAFDETYS